MMYSCPAYLCFKQLDRDNKGTFTTGLKVTTEKADDTENYILNFSLSHNYSFYFQSGTNFQFRLVDHKNKEVVYLNRKYASEWIYKATQIDGHCCYHILWKVQKIK